MTEVGVSGSTRYIGGPMDNTNITNTEGCALHNPSLPTAHVERDGIFDMIGAKRLPNRLRLPESFTVLLHGDKLYGMLRTDDRKVHLIEHGGPTGEIDDYSISNIVIVEQGQKLRVSQDYHVFDASGPGVPVLRDC